MTKTVRCFCGFQVAGDEDSVVAAMIGHAREFHQMTLDRERVLAMAEPSSEA